MIESRPGDAFGPGDLLNNTYRIESILGRGGTSDVYRVRNEINGRLMALKVLKAEFSSNDDYTVLLTREEQIREVQHDSVVRYSENGRTDRGLVYLLMDYVEGPALDAKLKQGAMSADDLLTIAREVTGGLHAAHSRNIVHRDLSPDNIILRDGDPQRPVIIDFGIAKDTNPGAETIVGNEFAGKYAYAAPEQLSGQTDARSDIYSLGATLLANFRGENPDVGRNPMEVVQRKSQPLDTSGVPEPLKSLIDRMCAPDPAMRIQSASDVLAYLSNPGDVPAPPATDAPDMEATIVVPVTKPPAQRSTAPSEAPSTPSPAPAPERKSRTGLAAVIALAVVGAGASGAYFAGALDPLLGPQYPPADPYTLTLERLETGQTSGSGFVPSEDVLETLNARLDTTDLTLASGDIATSWGSNVIEILNRIEGLEEWQVDVDGNSVSIVGETSIRDRAEAVTASLDALKDQIALAGSIEIVYKPPFLPTSAVTAVLDELADCGPFSQPQATDLGYGPQSNVVISGLVASTATRIEVFDRLREVVGDRQVVLDLEVLNPTLCLVESYLPDVPPGGVKIEYRMGDTGEVNTSGRFFVGENPVIDVVLPADVVDGYLTVSVLDVTQSVFHLLPNQFRRENSVQALRNGQSGEVPVRVAFPIDLPDRTSGQIAFNVTDDALGKSKIIALISSEPMFDINRPTESAEGFAIALEEINAQKQGNIRTIDSRIIETTRP